MDETKKQYILSEEQWAKLGGQEFGGESDIIKIEPGQFAGPFQYAGHSKIVTDLGEVTAHTAHTISGDLVRLPIQATFLRAIDQAGVQLGDTFAIGRGRDVKKKKGKGAGNDMAIYKIKLITRHDPAA